MSPRITGTDSENDLNRLGVSILGDDNRGWFLQDLPLELLLLIGLFLVGGEFWNKVRELFRHAARVEIVAEAPAAPA
jgi:hypothetical protein